MIRSVRCGQVVGRGAVEESFPGFFGARIMRMLRAVLFNQNITCVRGTRGGCSYSRLCEHHPVRRCHLAKKRLGLHSENKASTIDSSSIRK